MRYRLVPGPGCPSDLCERLNAALSTPCARRVFHAAKSAYRAGKDHFQERFLAYLTDRQKLPAGELEAILERASLDFHQAMLLPVMFDMTARCDPVSG